MLTPIHLQAAAEVVAGRMLNSLAEGLVLAIFAWLLLRLMQRQNSSSRFALLFSVLAAIALLPIADAFWPRTSATSLVHPALQLPGFWAVDLIVVWALIAAIGLARIAHGFFQLRRLRKSATVVEAHSLDPIVSGSLHEFGANRRVTLCTSAEVRVPTAIGFLSPVVVIPAWGLEELSPAELNAVVLHELAHLRRRDDWTNLAQRIVRALLFFHPAVWWIGPGLAREREMACDDFVLAATDDRRAYARCLVSVAEKSFLRRSLALAQAMVGQVQLTAQRVARILDPRRPQPARSTATTMWKPAFALVAAFSVGAMLSLQHAPQLVAFGAAGSTVSSSSGAPALAFDSSAGLPSRLAAKTIPASFITPSNAAAHRKNMGVRAVRLSLRRPTAVTLAGVVPATFVQRQSDSSEARSLSAQTPQPHSVLVFMQTEQIDEAGRIWSISVWHLTVFHPVDPNLNREGRKEITPKST
jgi:beta-lactamase regulating signal transducer with metallopeptidase domain